MNLGKSVRIHVYNRKQFAVLDIHLYQEILQTVHRIPIRLATQNQGNVNIRFCILRPTGISPLQNNGIRLIAKDIRHTPGTLLSSHLIPLLAISYGVFSIPNKGKAYYRNG